MARNIDSFEYSIGVGMADTDPPFYALLTALILRADTTNLEALREAFPDDVEYVQRRWNDG